jgi:nicotinamide riboside kinase
MVLYDESTVSLPRFVDIHDFTFSNNFGNQIHTRELDLLGFWQLTRHCAIYLTRPLRYLLFILHLFMRFDFRLLQLEKIIQKTIQPNKSVMSLKIAFTGPESSGKTTISKLLALSVNGIWIEEYAREYLQSKNGYEIGDLDNIAKGQIKKWSFENKLLVADTEMTVIKVWSEYRYNSCSDFIQMAYQNQQFDHYFLCKPDIPWEFDPLRENPTNRDELFERYRTELQAMKRPFTILEGTIEERLTSCKNVLNKLLN